MDARTNAKREIRTLGKYVKAKLNVSLARFSDDEGICVSTLNDQWNSERQRVRVMDAVFRYYVNRFEGM